MTDRIVVRGGGDLASGVIHRLFRCGYRILILESELPSAIRRKVAFCEAVYEGVVQIEGVRCRRIERMEQCEEVWKRNELPLLIDPEANAVRQMRPAAVIDAILAKKNLGTERNMAPLTIALGPGFRAGADVDFVVETMRGHSLGRIITQGCAFPNTGIPGVIAGVGKERVIHSPAAGIIHNLTEIADLVEEGQVLARVGETPVYASISGVLRGIIRDGYPVREGLKIADIDPRESERENCFTISDKARCIAGSVLEILISQKVLPDAEGFSK